MPFSWVFLSFTIVVTLISLIGLIRNLVKWVRNKCKKQKKQPIAPKTLKVEAYKDFSDITKNSEIKTEARF